MSNTIYSINKGINKPLEYRGLKAQYIGYLAGGLIADLMLFSIMYIAGMNSYIAIIIGVSFGGLVFFYVYKLNNKYGQYGWMQKRASGNVPTVIKSHSRKFLIKK